MNSSPDDKPAGPEFPDRKKLGVYGDVLFLTMRSEHHRQMSVANLRDAMEPPIEAGQFRIFRFDDIPRGLMTWAWLNPDAERRLIAGEGLRPEDWQSGEHLWLIDLIAPYKGLITGMSRWIMQPGNFAKRRYYFRRVINGNQTRRIVEVDFERKAKMAKMMQASDFDDGLR